VPLSVGELGPHVTPTSVPSDILIHPTVWPQYTNVTDVVEVCDRKSEGVADGHDRNRQQDACDEDCRNKAGQHAHSTRAIRVNFNAEKHEYTHV